MTDVHALRERLGWSQVQLGRFLAVSGNTVWRWESGTEPQGLVAEALATLEAETRTQRGVDCVKDAEARGENATTFLRRGLNEGVKRGDGD